ncbi:MAG: hypothetical protein Kow0013_08980 [Pararhodobacter sp.]
MSILTRKAHTLYLGKLAVEPGARRRGLGLPSVTLQTRVELLDNHKTFASLGFHEIARTAHAGFDRPTSITFRRSV